jgi:hypothetical protein
MRRYCIALQNWGQFLGLAIGAFLYRIVLYIIGCQGFVFFK